MMKPPTDAEIIACADNEIDDPTRRQQIEEYINSSEELQDELEFYGIVQRIRDEKNATSQGSTTFQMTPTLQAEIRKQAVALRQKRAPWWKKTIIMPMPIAAAAVLAITAVSIWTISQLSGLTPSLANRGVMVSLDDGAYHAWGDTEPVQSQGGFDPPALQGDVDDRPGRLTAALLWVLQNPEPTTAAFWNALSAALAEQGLTVPESLRTLAVEDSLFAEIQGTEPILDRRIRLIFNHQEKTLVIQRQE